MSKPHLSRLILVGTGLIIAVVLLVWLLLFLGRDPVRFDGFWVSPTEMGGPWLAHQAADVHGVVVPLKGKGRPIEPDAFDRSLREHLGRSGNRPVVLYVSAAGVSDRNGGFLLPHEPGAIPSSTTSEARDSLFTLEKLVAVCREFPSKPKLILWDAGQIGSDRNLGVYANGFLHELKKALEKTPSKLAILCSCAPGQTSWASEFDGRSVFGYYVEMGLSGQGRRLRRPFERPHGEGAEPIRQEPGRRLGEDEPAGRADARAHRRPVDEFPPAPCLPREIQALRGATGRRGSPRARTRSASWPGWNKPGPGSTNCGSVSPTAPPPCAGNGSGRRSCTPSGSSAAGTSGRPRTSSAACRGWRATPRHVRRWTSPWRWSRTAWRSSRTRRGAPRCAPRAIRSTRP